MSEHQEHIVDEVSKKVAQRATTPDDTDLIREKAAEAVDELIERPVQTFTPLLAENEVVTELVQERHAEQTEERADGSDT